jgi:hypothetical protein
MVKSLKVIRFEWSEQKKTIIALITPNSDSSIDQYINSLKNLIIILQFQCMKAIQIGSLINHKDSN